MLHLVPGRLDRTHSSQVEMGSSSRTPSRETSGENVLARLIRFSHSANLPPMGPLSRPAVTNPNSLVMWPTRPSRSTQPLRRPVHLHTAVPRNEPLDRGPRARKSLRTKELKWWAVQDSNLRLRPCDDRTLPTELTAHSRSGARE